MTVTVDKVLNGKVVVSASLAVATLEDLIIFSQSLGYTQALDEYVADFQSFKDVTYRMGLN